MNNLLATIKECIKNNPREQRRLYEHYYGYCLKTVFRYIYHYDKAVDIVNDGFIKIFRSLDKFQVSEGQDIHVMFMGWIRMIMINTAIDYLRKNSFTPEIGSIAEDVWAQEDKSRAPDQGLLYKELILQVKTLPPAYRAAFNMYVIDGFTHQEIADCLGISVGTSKSNLSKARAHLQKTLGKNDSYKAICMM